MDKIIICTALQAGLEQGYYPALQGINNAVAQLSMMHIVESGGVRAGRWIGDVAKNRNKLIRRAYEMEAPGLLFWDADIEATVAKAKQIVSLQLDIVGGAYEQRGVSGCWCAARAVRDIKTEVPYVLKGELDVISVPWVGAGFLYLSRRAIIDAMNLPEEPFNQIEIQGNTLGEDVSFCQRMKAIGYEIMLDQSCQVKHRFNFQPEGCMSNNIKLELSNDNYKILHPDVAEGEQYQVVNGAVFDKDGVAVGEKETSVPRRDLELGILKSLAEFGANNEKESKNSYRMLDVLGQLENLEDTEEFFVIDKADFDRLVKAYEHNAGNRPLIWLKEGRALIKQLAEPKEA